MRQILLIAVLLFLIIQCSSKTTAGELSISESIGAYTAGCIRNSAALSTNGEGFQVIRPGRGRYYGNPETIEYIESLSKKANKELNTMLLIADISQQTGGPILDDHSSHQIGLDADILLWQHPIAKQRTLTITEREHIHPQSVLTDDEMAVDEFKWDEIHGGILKIAASDTRVDRIFINPVIFLLHKNMVWRKNFHIPLNHQYEGLFYFQSSILLLPCPIPLHQKSFRRVHQFHDIFCFCKGNHR